MRILIVEDEERLAKTLQKALAGEGYAADYVTDGETAERRIEVNHQDYDLVILDWMLPKKSGLEVLANVRKQKISVPVLVLTARFNINDKVLAFDQGADDYMVKPFSFAELLARIRAILRRPQESLPTILSLGDLSLDAGERKVTRGKREIELTVKEFSLLEYLMRHPNQVVSRHQIVDQLWGYDFDSFSNVVDVHIKNLRKKIKDSTGRIIQTVRGIGYRIKAD